MLQHQVTAAVFYYHQLHHDLGKMEASLTKHSQGQRSSLSDLRRDIKLLEDRYTTEAITPQHLQQH